MAKSPDLSFIIDRKAGRNDSHQINGRISTELAYDLEQARALMSKQGKDINTTMVIRRAIADAINKVFATHGWPEGYQDTKKKALEAGWQPPKRVANKASK